MLTLGLERDTLFSGGSTCWNCKDVIISFTTNRSESKEIPLQDNLPYTISYVYETKNSKSRLSRILTITETLPRSIDSAKGLGKINSLGVDSKSKSLTGCLEQDVMSSILF